MRILIEEDRVTRKGLQERYMKVQEENAKEGLHLEGVTVKDGKVESKHDKDLRKQLKRIEDWDVKAELLWLEDQQKALEKAFGVLTRDEYAKVEAAKGIQAVANKRSMHFTKNKPC